VIYEDMARNAERRQEWRRAWRKANAEKIRQQKRARYWARVVEKRAREGAPLEKSAAELEAMRLAKREERNAKKRARCAANPEKARAASRAWHTANREKALDKLKKRYADPAYLERHRAREKARYVAQPEKIKLRTRAWAKNNPDKVRSIFHRRRSRMRGTHSRGVTAAEWQALVELFNGCCAYCGKRGKKLTVDHIVPIAKHGRDEIENVLPACRSCNCSKNNKDLEAWLKERGFTDPRVRLNAGAASAAG
jgi:5-methylcytosine-specific restriction endonuclease McrA